MRILFLTNDLRVKHFHMASAIRANMDAEIHFMHIWPRRRKIRSAYGKIIGGYKTAKFINDAKESRVFDSVQAYDPRKFEDICPDIVYVNDLDGVRRTMPTITKEWISAKIVCDIEDLALMDIDMINVNHRSRLTNELMIMNTPFINSFLFGSEAEYQRAEEVYSVSRFTNVSARIQYPYVAKSTLPASRVRKTEDFSVVYAGSVWQGGYRDCFDKFVQLGRLGIHLDMYLLNDWSGHNWKILKEISDKYESVSAFHRLKLFEVKEKIQQYHAGLYLTGDYMKVRATYGMKPLEYAYAGVVPVGISDKEIEPVKNLSNGEPFGYVTKVSEIVENYCREDYLKDFDWDYHLMDNHLNEFKELIR